MTSTCIRTNSAPSRGPARMAHRTLARVWPVVLVAMMLSATGCKKALVIEVRGAGQVTLPDVEMTCKEPTCTVEVSTGPQNVVAAPGPDHVFIGFRGGNCSEKATCVLDVSDDVTLTAVFEPLVEIKMEVRGDGKLSADEQKATCPDVCTFKVKRGTEVRFRRQAGKDTFVGFSGDCPDRKDCTFIAEKPKTVIAEFAAPSGTVAVALTAGPANDEKPAVTAAFDEKGGFAVAANNGTSVSVSRIDAAGKLVFGKKVATGKVVGAPGLVFYGDDLLLMVSDTNSSTLIRLSPDGKDERFKKLHNGCPGLGALSLEGDGIFASGTFKGSHSCGNIELISSGGRDIVAARFSVDDGGLIWAAQVGSNRDDAFNGASVNKEEELIIAWSAAKDGGRITRVNPAGKPFPEQPFGKPTTSTDLLDVKVVDKGVIRVMGHIVQPTDFGGDTIGPPSRDNIKRIVVLKQDVSGRHLASSVVGRSSCDESSVCGFDPDGGYARAQKDLASGEETSMRLVRAGADGTERWSVRFKGDGKGTVTDVIFAPGPTVIIVGVFEGTLEVGSQSLQAKQPAAFAIRLKD